MRIAILTLGTRGDIQPYVALALGLQGAGHQVVLAAPTQFQSMVVSHGIEHAPLPGELLELMDTPEGKAAMSGRKKLGAGLALLRRVKPLMRQLLDAELAACDFRPELIVHHPKALGAPHIAEWMGVPAVLAAPLPGFTPTAAFPSPLLPFSNLGPLNRLSHRAAVWAAESAFSGVLGRWRAEALALPARRPRLTSATRPTLYAFSPSVVPVPADWGPQVLVSGYWFLEDRTGWTMPPDLGAFLDQGPPPVYVGFGSMPSADAERTTRVVVEALGQAGQRGLLATGWGGLVPTGLPGRVHAIEAAPHDRLFPLVSAVVHHGGAGSTAASLRAGRPTLICPFFGDQPFWGRRVATLGAGPRPISQKELTVERLTRGIVQAVSDPALRRQAGALGAAIRAEDGIGNAVRFLEQLAS